MAFTTPQDVIDRARSLWYVSSSQYSDTKALQDYNIVRQDLSNLIMQDVNENYFSDIIRTDWVIDQNEYALTDATNNVDVNKIEDVFIKYNDTNEYVKAYKQNKDYLRKEMSEYNTTQSSSNPFYYVFADSIFIYPAITTDDNWGANVTNWIKLEVWLTPTELAIGDTDSLFPAEYRHLIALWMLPYIYQRKWLVWESNNSSATFENWKTDMILSLTDRVSVPQSLTLPDLTYFE